MKSLVKKAPSFVLFVLLAVVYLGCGYIIGYHQGYKMGQEDYIIYINKIFEGIKMEMPKEDAKEEPKVEPKKEEPKEEPKKEVGLPK